MKTQLQCLPCFIRQALEAASIATDDPAIHEAILRKALSMTSEFDLTIPPPVIGQWIHRMVRQMSRNPDPYLNLKQQCNTLAQQLIPSLRNRLEAAEAPLEMALRLAMAGNIIDYGVNHHFGLDRVETILEEALDSPLDPSILDRFTTDLKRAERILYLADNAGEIFLDRLLIEQLPMEKITLAVRGAPIINDALLDDARLAGITELVTVIDNGSDAPGTVLEDCHEQFRTAFQHADLIISKGQGNFETLNDAPHNIFFLLKAKCLVAGGLANVPLGHNIFIHSQVRPLC